VIGDTVRIHLLFLSIAILPLVVNTAHAQSTCGEMTEPKSLEDAYIKQPAPLIFGDHHPVPRMRVRFIDSKTGQPLKTKSVKVHYRWRWLEYPYSEHAWGAWAEASDSCTCHPDKDGWIEVPAHEVVPRGWYDGKYTRWPYPKKPRFDQIEIVALTGYFARTSIAPKDLQQFEEHELVITVQDGGKATILWQPSTSP